MWVYGNTKSTNFYKDLQFITGTWFKIHMFVTNIYMFQIRMTYDHFQQVIHKDFVSMFHVIVTQIFRN